MHGIALYIYLRSTIDRRQSRLSRNTCWFHNGTLVGFRYLQRPLPSWVTSMQKLSYLLQWFHRFCLAVKSLPIAITGDIKVYLERALYTGLHKLRWNSVQMYGFRQHAQSLTSNTTSRHPVRPRDHDIQQFVSTYRPGPLSQSALHRQCFGDWSLDIHVGLHYTLVADIFDNQDLLDKHASIFWVYCAIAISSFVTWQRMLWV